MRHEAVPEGFFAAHPELKGVEAKARFKHASAMMAEKAFLIFGLMYGFSGILQWQDRAHDQSDAEYC